GHLELSNPDEHRVELLFVAGKGQRRGFNPPSRLVTVSVQAGRERLCCQSRALLPPDDNDRDNL
ncbi:MAG: hypothetical protein ACK53V_25205, partial [Planctomycetota bacterium]